MRRASLWADAQARAATLLRKSSPADQVAIFSFDRQIVPLMTFDQWGATAPGERVPQALDKIGHASPGSAATYLGNALIRAAEILSDAGAKQMTFSNQIVLISDLQEGSHLEPMQGYEWPKDVQLSVETLKPKHSGNASLQLVTGSDEGNLNTNATVRVRVMNSSDSKREQFNVGWALPEGSGFAAAPLELYVPMGQSRIVSLPLPASSAIMNRVLLQGDDEDFDNTVFVVPPETQKLKVLYFGDESETDSRQPLYFLRRGFQETRRQQVQVSAHNSSQGLSTQDSSSSTLCIVSGSFPEDIAKGLHEEALSGKALLFVPRGPESAPSLSRLLGVENLTLEEVHPDNYAMLGEIDFRHPLFAPFADPRYSDFTKIHFWRYRRLAPSAIPAARVIARFDNGDPALLEVPVGKGRVFVLTSGWQPDDSQLALSTKFVPLLYSMLEQTGAPEPPLVTYQVGDTVPFGSKFIPGQTGLTVMAPDGSKTQFANNYTNFSGTAVPGIYNVLNQGGVKEFQFAVNLDATEGRTAPLPVDELERLGAPVTRAASSPLPETQRQLRLQNAELENRQKLWRWLIVATLVVLLIETYFAGRTAREVINAPGRAVT